MTVAKEFELLGAKPAHPYYPEGIALSGGVFNANHWDVLTLILVFASGWAAILATTLAIVKKVNPGLKSTDRLLVLWFVLSKLIVVLVNHSHCFSAFCILCIVFRSGLSTNSNVSAVMRHSGTVFYPGLS